MASLISVANGNMSDNTKWKVASAGTRAIQAAHTASTDTTNAYVYNGNTEDITIANLEVIEGVMLFVCNKAGQDQTGVTFYIALSADSGTTATKEFQCDGVLIPDYPSWVFFKFATALTGDGGTDYAIGVKSSTAGKQTVYRNATAQNWTHLLRTDQNPAARPASAEPLYIVGEFTDHDTHPEYTITMDEVVGDAIDHGTIDIGHEGNLDYDITAAHNPYMRVSGAFNIWCDGDLRMGDDAGGAVPDGSVASLLMDSASAGQYSILVNDGGRFYSKGQTKLGTTKITSNCSSGQKVLTVASTSGWKAGDTIVVAATERVTAAARQSEEKIIDTVDSATQVTVTVNFSYNHSGTSPTQGHVINLTRNVKVFGASLANNTNLTVTNYGLLELQYLELYWASNSTSTAAIHDQTKSGGTGGCNLAGVSIYNCNGAAYRLTNNADADNVDINDLVIYNTNITMNNSFSFSIDGATTGTSISIQNLTCIKTLSFGAAGNMVTLNDVGITFKNIVLVDNYGNGSAQSGGLSIGNDSNAWIPFGAWDNIECYGMYAIGVILLGNGNINGTISNLKCWRNGVYGIGSTNIAGSYLFGDIELINPVLFANLTANFNIYQGTYFHSLTLRGGRADGDASFASASGIALAGVASTGKIILIDFDMGNSTAHTTGDINLSSTGIRVEMDIIHCILASTEIANPTYLTGGYIKQHYTDNSLEFTTNSALGSINQDTTIRHTASGYSWKLTPSKATNKLILPGVSHSGIDTFRVAVNSGSLVTITAYVYKDASYNGNEPRLVLLGGIVASVGTGGTDVTDTATVASDEAWEGLQVTCTPGEAGVLEFYVDCDGTAGNVYVDDITITQA